MSKLIIQDLKRFISKEILHQPNKMILPTEPLLSSGLIDDVSLMDLSLFIEDHFDVYIDEAELNEDAFDTLEELSDLIRQRASRAR
jgi:acyl carrier protein